MVAPLGLLVGVLLVAAGTLGVRHARAITRFQERLDAVGSRRSGDVEPADWNVAATRVFAACAAGVGGFVVLLSMLD